MMMMMVAWLNVCLVLFASSSGGKGRKLKVMGAAAESTTPSSARESIFDVMLSGPRPIVSILIACTDCARRHLATVLRRVLQEGFQVVGLKLYLTLTTVKDTLSSSVCTTAWKMSLVYFVGIYESCA